MNARSHKQAVRETITVRPSREALPMDAVARRVTSPGIVFEPTYTPHHEIWDVPPPLAPLDHPARMDPGFEDLTGSVCGRMRIVGFLGRKKNPTGSAWLARCSCGKYEVRRSRNWKRAVEDGTEFMCGFCNYLQQLHGKREAYYRGENPGYYRESRR